MTGNPVIGRPLAEAERLLEEAGETVIEVERTAPPGGGPAGPLRVVREQRTKEGVRLLAASSVVLEEQDAER